MKVKIGDSEISLNKYMTRIAIQIKNPLIHKGEFYEAIKIFNIVLKNLPTVCITFG